MIPKDEARPPPPNCVCTLTGSALPPNKLFAGGFASLLNIDGLAFWAVGVEVTTLGGTEKLSLGTVGAIGTAVADP